MTFLKRLCSTVVLLGVLSCIIFGNKMLSQILFLAFGAFISFFAPYETCVMLKSGGKNVYPKTVSAFVSAVFLIVSLTNMFFIHRPEMENLIPFLETVLLFAAALPWFFLLFTAGNREKLEGILFSCGVFFLFSPAFLMICNIYSTGISMFLFFILGTKIGDIGAYVTGTVTNKLMKGNHKMVPKISPGKSWEGAAGGMIVSILFSIVMFRIFGFQGSVLAAGIFGAVLFVFGAVGDLAESSLKRSCGVKDSGRTIPGIGGVFDLVDSLLLNALIFQAVIVSGLPVFAAN